VIKSRIMRLTGHAARVHGKRRPLGRPGRLGRMMLKWISKKYNGNGACSGLIWLRTGTGGGLL
jgi:hypothetical protein